MTTIRGAIFAVAIIGAVLVAPFLVFAYILAMKNEAFRAIVFAFTAVVMVILGGLFETGVIIGAVSWALDNHGEDFATLVFFLVAPTTILLMIGAVIAPLHYMAKGRDLKL